ncbi:MAG: hypothetical protein ACLPKB_24685 [Xanthobacteraceae bacterium]
MCFGNSQTSTTQTTPTPNAAVAGLANQNLSAVGNLEAAGFTPYSGQQVANFSPLQNTSFGMAGNLASSGVPNVGQAQSLINNYTNAGPQSVQANSIASQMSPYMNQYVSQALAPQLAGMQQQEALQSQLNQGAATSAGAFGDPRANMLQQNQNFLSGLQQQGVIGNAYNNAFNTAIGAGSQDVANSLAAQTTNANLYNQYLAQQLAGAQAEQGLGTYQVGTGSQLAGIANQYGAQQTAQNQAQLNAAYNQWLMAQQYPFQTAQLANQAEQAGAQAMPASTTSVTSAPNNAGWGILGSIGGALLGNSGFGSALGNSLFGSNNSSPQFIPVAYNPGYNNNAPILGEGGDLAAREKGIVGDRGAEVFIPDSGPDGAVVVGKDGPEEFVPQEAGTIIPNEHVRGIARALGIAPPVQQGSPRGEGAGAPAGWMRALGLDPAHAPITLGALGQGLSAGAQPGMSGWASFAKGLGGALQGGAAAHQQQEQQNLARQKQRLALAQSAREQQNQDFNQRMANLNATRAQQALDDLNRYRQAMLTLEAPGPSRDR